MSCFSCYICKFDPLSTNYWHKTIFRQGGKPYYCMLSFVCNLTNNFLLLGIVNILNNKHDTAEIHASWFSLVKNSIHSPSWWFHLSGVHFLFKLNLLLIIADGIIYVGGKHELHIICHGTFLALNKRQITRSVAGDHLAR